MSKRWEGMRIGDLAFFILLSWKPAWEGQCVWDDCWDTGVSCLFGSCFSCPFRSIAGVLMHHVWFGQRMDHIVLYIGACFVFSSSGWGQFSLCSRSIGRHGIAGDG